MFEIPRRALGKGTCLHPRPWALPCKPNLLFSLTLKEKSLCIMLMSTIFLASVGCAGILSPAGQRPLPHSRVGAPSLPMSLSFPLFSWILLSCLTLSAVFVSLPLTPYLMLQPGPLVFLSRVWLGAIRICWNMKHLAELCPLLISTQLPTYPVPGHDQGPERVFRNQADLP